MLRLSGVSKTFNAGSAREVQAVGPLDLALSGGCWVSMIGSNGAGKTTLIKLISGECSCDRGSILLDGVEVTNWTFPRRSRLIGRVFQSPEDGTAASLTIEENLIVARQRGHFGLRLGARRGLRELFRRHLAELGLSLENRLSDPVASLSGGERQALALLMCAVKDPAPKVFLLDEHVSRLDPRVAEAVMQLTARVVTENQLTTIMVTHKIQDALRFGERLIMLHRGRIVLDLQGEEKASATVEEIVSRFHDVSGGEDEALPDEAIL